MAEEDYKKSESSSGVSSEESNNEKSYPNLELVLENIEKVLTREEIYQDPTLFPKVVVDKPNKGDIYQELKSDFKKIRSNRRTNYFSYILAVVLIVCMYFFIHGNNTDREISRDLNYIQVDGQATEVSDVKIIKIPQEVFDNMEINPDIPQEVYDKVQIDRTRDKYLFGDKKLVLLITWNGCPYACKFRKELDSIFSKNISIGDYYLKEVRETGQTVSLGGCIDGYNCAAIRLFENCGEGICIINPMTREIIADTSQNTKQILPLLQAYKTRQDKPLLD